ncbi:MAG: RNA polymerase sigma factor SigJ [Woeseiaceae bacterium]|nr:RNA polymerase sigma factor SigJ [Woeseiaceae bacterium]
MHKSVNATIFESVRPTLLGLAYRILGSFADAEDAVQDTFVDWTNAKHESIDNPQGWLTTTCTRRCLDLLRAAHRTRVNYVGAWLPEPVQVPVERNSEADMELAASLKTAFLLVLERLTPRERAAYLLHEVFEMPYPEVAETLDTTESACRQLVSRAKSHLDQSQTRFTTPVERQDELLTAFQAAITEGSIGRLASLLAVDVQLTADGGGKVPTIRKVLRGMEAVTTFLTRSLHEYWSGLQWNVVDVNGERGVVLTDQGRVDAVVSFAYDQTGKATDVFIVRNPDKLGNLREISLH